MTPYYDDGHGIVIYHGDCREVLPGLNLLQVAVVLTDPPYGIAYHSNRDSSWREAQIAGDTDTTTRDAALRLLAGLPALVFSSWKSTVPQGTHTVLVWDKGPASGMGNLDVPWKPSWEMITPPA